MIHRFPNLTGFDWDDGNHLKNERKHGVTAAESEQVFFNEPLIVFDNAAHSETEPRYAVLGRTDHDRLLTIIFTIRNAKLPVISARAMSRKERAFYHAYQKEHPEV